MNAEIPSISSIQLAEIMNLANFAIESDVEDAINQMLLDSFQRGIETGKKTACELIMQSLHGSVRIITGG